MKGESRSKGRDAGPRAAVEAALTTALDAAREARPRSAGTRGRTQPTVAVVAQRGAGPARPVLVFLRDSGGAVVEALASPRETPLRLDDAGDGPWSRALPVGRLDVGPAAATLAALRGLERGATEHLYAVLHLPRPRGARVELAPTWLWVATSRRRTVAALVAATDGELLGVFPLPRVRILPAISIGVKLLMIAALAFAMWLTMPALAGLPWILWWILLLMILAIVVWILIEAWSSVSGGSASPNAGRLRAIFGRVRRRQRLAEERKRIIEEAGTASGAR